MDRYDMYGAVIVLAIVIFVCLATFTLFGGLAATSGYTVQAGLGDEAPAPPVYLVREVRKRGEDRTIFKTLDISEAIRIMREMEDK